MQHGLVVVHSGSQKRRHRSGASFEGAPVADGQEVAHVGPKPRQVTKPDRQGTKRIKQKPGQAFGNTRFRQRQYLGHSDGAGISVGRPVAVRVAVNDGNPKPSALQVESATKPDDTGANDDTLWRVSAHSLHVWPIGEGLFNGGHDSCALVSFKRHAREAHPFSALTGHLVCEFDHLHQLGVDVQM